MKNHELAAILMQNPNDEAMQMAEGSYGFAHPINIGRFIVLERAPKGKFGARFGALNSYEVITDTESRHLVWKYLSTKSMSREEVVANFHPLDDDEYDGCRTEESAVREWEQLIIKMKAEIQKCDASEKRTVIGKTDEEP